MPEGKRPMQMPEASDLVNQRVQRMIDPNVVVNHVDG